MQNFKFEIHQQLLLLIKNKLKEIDAALTATAQSAENETKSSMGDKYETARAMIQSEVNKLLNSKLLIENQLNELKNLNPQQTILICEKGALITTNYETFYFSVPYGKLQISGKEIFVISPNSPIGIAFKSKKVGDTIRFKGKNYSIISVN